MLSAACERRGVDLSRVDVLLDTFTAPLPLHTTETSCLGGKHLRITGECCAARNFLTFRFDFRARPRTGYTPWPNWLSVTSSKLIIRSWNHEKHRKCVWRKFHFVIAFQRELSNGCSGKSDESVRITWGVGCGNSPGWVLFAETYAVVKNSTHNMNVTRACAIQWGRWGRARDNRPRFPHGVASSLRLLCFDL